MGVGARPHRLRWATTAVFGAAFAALLFGMARMRGDATGMLSDRVALLAGLSALLYLVSHLMRAIRLAAIAMPLLGVSFRTTILLHLFVAPWSLVLPFKIDELIRLNELRKAARSWTRSIVALFIDRSMDAIVLLAFALVLFANGHSELGGSATILGVGLLVLALTFFVLPMLLETVQRYIVMSHYHDRSFDLLRAVSHARAILGVSKGTIASAAPFLILATIGIWALECTAVALFVGAVAPDTPLLGRLEATMQRADASWRILLAGSPAPAPLTLLTLIYFGTLLLAWLAVAYAYQQRLPHEPMRPRLPAPRGQPLAAAMKRG